MKDHYLTLRMISKATSSLQCNDCKTTLKQGDCYYGEGLKVVCVDCAHEGEKRGVYGLRMTV